MLARVRLKFEETVRQLVQQTVIHDYGTVRQPNAEKALTAAEKSVKTLTNQLMRTVRDRGLLDREFDQFGQNALKTVLKEISNKVKEWTAAVAIPDNKPTTDPAEADVNGAAEALTPTLIEFAKLDGYNIWRRSIESLPRIGKLVPSEDATLQRQPVLLSWIVPVRQWAELESWGED